MELHHFFEPVNTAVFNEETNDGKVFNVGNLIKKHSENQTPEIKDKDLVILGIKTSPEDNSPDWIRNFFYELKIDEWASNLVDAGNYVLDKNDDKKVEALSFALSELLDLGACPVIMGGSQEITYLNYLAYESLDRMVNLVTVDNRIDFTDEEVNRLKPQTFLQDILLRDPSYLFNMSFLGLQHYFVGNSQMETFQDMYFDLYRVGKIRDNMKNIEPVIRHGDFLSFDIGSIRQSDAPGNNHPAPNGFYGEEACLLSKFAGLSENITSIGFYEYNAAFDREGQTAQLIAQMIWHFVFGYLSREREHPQENSENFYKYITTLKAQDHKIVFYKSRKTDRWWMGVPIENYDPYFKDQAIIPCAYEDYLAASSDEIPERWWHALQKLS